MSLMLQTVEPVETIGTRVRRLASVGLCLHQPPMPRVAAARPWKQQLKRAVAPYALAACDFVEVTIEAAGFGLLMILFLGSFYILS